MTNPITDPTTDTDAMPSAALAGDVPPPMLDASEGADATMQAGGGGGAGMPMRERIHQLAAMAHRAIDALAQRLGGQGAGVASMDAMGGYGEQARQYGQQLRERVTAQPLQSAGIALAAGMVLGKVFTAPRAPKVRVVHVPAPRALAHGPGQPLARPASRWLHAADAGLEDLGAAGQKAAGTAGATAGLALAGVKAMAATLAHKAGALPPRLGLVAQRLLAKSQAYGTVARAGVQAHPLAGVGVAFCTGALAAAALVLRNRQPAPGTAYVTVDEKGNGIAFQHDRPDVQSPGVGAVIASRPVTSAVVVFGLGALAGALLLKNRV